MARLSPKTDTLRALFARLGNQCSFPNCEQHLINEKNQFVGQVCHIEAALPLGERYKKNSNDEYRRSYENLILLCYPHHIETNNVEEFNAQLLLEIKKKHEGNHLTKKFSLNDEDLMKIERDLNQYWLKIERLNSVDHVIPALALDVGGKREVLAIIDDVRDSLSGVDDLLGSLAKYDNNIEVDFDSLLRKMEIDPKVFEDIPHYENPFVNRNWELHALASTNLMTKLSVDLLVLEIKYLEVHVQINKDDDIAVARLLQSKNSLEKISGNVGYAD
jgi:hypothetical protein